jgi:hypothetical protein
LRAAYIHRIFTKNWAGIDLIGSDILKCNARRGARAGRKKSRAVRLA